MATMELSSDDQRTFKDESGRTWTLPAIDREEFERIMREIDALAILNGEKDCCHHPGHQAASRGDARTVLALHRLTAFQRDDDGPVCKRREFINGLGKKGLEEGARALRYVASAEGVDLDAPEFCCGEDGSHLIDGQRWNVRPLKERVFTDSLGRDWLCSPVTPARRAKIEAEAETLGRTFDQHLLFTLTAQERRERGVSEEQLLDVICDDDRARRESMDAMVAALDVIAVA